MDLQGLVDMMSKGWRAQRSLSQMTLIKLIGTLKSLPPENLISGLGTAGSYRGYYSDLAFEPDPSVRTVLDLLRECEAVLGKTFQGYKGGDYLMDEHTPLWVASYGDTGGMLMGLATEQNPMVPIIAPEEE